ncbi:hypothetical protein E0J20_09160 [Rhizobium leguminosarum bv. viciae]|nr:hypothetical protein E0J20_09160 [Rhizobium leguminosarum bv. viciae]
MFKSVSKRLLRSTDYIFRNSNYPARRGDLVALGEFALPRKAYPWAWVEPPPGLERSLLAHGKVINGWNPAELSFWDMKETVLVDLAAKAGRRALALTAFLAAGVSALSFPQFMPTINALPDFPQWAVNSSAYGALAGWLLQSAAMMLWTSATIVINQGWPLALLFPVIWWFSFVQGMTTLWNSVSRNMRNPTIDALTQWRGNAHERKQSDKVHNRVVMDVIDRLPDMPFFKIGVSTGSMAAAGVLGAPVKGSWLGVDGESVRKHIIATGETGSGKTRLFLEPMFVQMVINATWPKGSSIGAYVTDGKGVLAYDLLPKCGKRQSDVRIVGIREGEYGVNLIKGMTPPELADAMGNVAAQLSGNPRAGEDFWPVMAAFVVKTCAIIARAVEFDEDAVADFIRLKGCRPYSLLGIYKLALDDELSAQAIEWVKFIFNSDDESDPERTAIIKEGLDAGTDLIRHYHSIAHETKTGYTGNIIKVLGRITDNAEVTKRFCTGVYDRTIDIDYCLSGGITMVAIGQSNAGDLGKFVAVWMKTRLMQAARARNQRDPEAAKKNLCVMMADEVQSLLTIGSADSDGEFWNVGRSSGMYLCCATQSIAAIEQAIGDKGMNNFLSNMATRVILKTMEKTTLAYYRELMGQSMQVTSSLNGVYSNHATMEENIRKPKPILRFSFLSGLFPTTFQVITAPRPPYNIARIRKANDEAPPEKRETEANLIRREEDMLREAIKESSQMKYVIDFKALWTGSDHAFVIVNRGTGMRYDMVDLNPILNEL